MRTRARSRPGVLAECRGVDAEEAWNGEEVRVAGEGGDGEGLVEGIADALAGAEDRADEEVVGDERGRGHDAGGLASRVRVGRAAPPFA